MLQLKKMYKEKPYEAIKRADEVSKNTYRTLMTRGFKAAIIIAQIRECGSILESVVPRCQRGSAMVVRGRYGPNMSSYTTSETVFERTLVLETVPQKHF